MGLHADVGEARTRIAVSLGEIGVGDIVEIGSLLGVEGELGDAALLAVKRLQESIGCRNHGIGGGILIGAGDGG